MITTFSICKLVSNCDNITLYNLLYIPPFKLGTALNDLADSQGTLGQLGQGDIFTGVQRTKDFRDGDTDLVHHFFPPAMQQPPAKSEIAAIGLKVISESLCEIIIVVLETDTGRLSWWRGKGDDARQVVPASKKVELDSSEEGQQGKGIEESK